MIFYTTYYFKINTNISRNILKSCIYFPRKNTQEMLNNLSEKHEEYKNFTPLISAILNVPIVVDPVPQDDDRAFQNPKIPMFQCSREDQLTISAKNVRQSSSRVTPRRMRKASQKNAYMKYLGEMLRR